MPTQKTSHIHILQDIPNRPDTIRTRGGFYSPDLNVWVPEDLDAFVQSRSKTQLELLDAFARMAVEAGALHRVQIEDAKEGRIWPAEWIQNSDGGSLVAFCREHPEAGHPYTCVRATGEVIPYSQAYSEMLDRLCQGIEQALLVADESIQKQAGYLRALIEAFRPRSDQVSDLEKMDIVDTEWVGIPTDTPLLLLSEFTESYSDPIKKRVVGQPEVQAWAGEVSERIGMAPWKFFFEFRVFASGNDALTPEEIAAIRKTNQRLYGTLGLGTPSERAMTEFRKVVMVAGHGANPPKNAKNYPNQAWIRRTHGYRNVIYANQVEASIQAEVLPSLRAAFPIAWAQSAALEEQALRLRALFIVGHEECHPWLIFDEAPWMEEFKCDLLGLWSLANTPSITVDIGDVMKINLGAMLLLHRYHEHLLARGDDQFLDYHVGNTIHLNHLLRQEVLVTDDQGRIMDVNLQKAVPAIETLAQRVISIRQGWETIQALYEDLHHPEIYERLGGWGEQQEYFWNLWNGK